MKIVEKLLGALMVISIVMKFLNLPMNGILFTLSTASLMMIYFYVGFALFNDIPFKGIFKKQSYKQFSVLRIIISIVAGFGFSTILTGVLFRLQHWPGANLNLGIGLIFLVVVIIVEFIRYLKNKDNLFRKLLIRFLIIGSFGLILLFTSDYAIDKVIYRDYSDYVKALDDLQQNPTSEELHNKVEFEYNRMIFTEEELESMEIKETF